MARSYELPSLSGSESAGILRFLMSLDKPSPGVVCAVKGVAWVDSPKITGPRYERGKNDGIATEDASAMPLSAWT